LAKNLIWLLVVFFGQLLAVAKAFGLPRLRGGLKPQKPTAGRKQALRFFAPYTIHAN